MSADYKLYIPSYVPTDFLVKLIAVISGDLNVKQKTSYDGVDFDLDSSKSNRWSLSYTPSDISTLSADSMVYPYYRITSAVLGKDMQLLSHTYNVHIDANIRDEQYMGYKLLSGRSTQLGIAIVINVINCLGGKLIYNDNKPNNFLIVENASINKEFFRLIEDENYYKSQNIIKNTPIISIQDLTNSESYAVYHLDIEDKMRIEKKILEIFINNEKRMIDKNTNIVSSMKDSEKFKL